MNDLDTLQREAFEIACAHGWWVDPCAAEPGPITAQELADDPGMRGRLVHTSGGPAGQIALIHSEITELDDALRALSRDNEQEECADIVIRIFNMAEHRGWRLDPGGYTPSASGVLLRAEGRAAWVAALHSRTSCMLEALRDPLDTDTRARGCASSIVAALDTSAAYDDWSLRDAIVAKMEVNRKRPYMHGGKLF